MLTSGETLVIKSATVAHVPEASTLDEEGLVEEILAGDLRVARQRLS